MSLNSFSYYMPTKVVYGRHSVRDIGVHIGHRSVLLITSKGFVKRGLVDEICTYTENISKVVSNVESHPGFSDVETIYKEAHQSKFDLIIAVGGGSVIDVAKFVSVYCDNRDYQFVEGLTKEKISKSGYKTIPVIAVPTTAGTGSEVTPYSTIWDKQRKRKYSLNLPDLFPEVAIYDPILTLTVPKDITIQTGLDTLSHALESIWNKNANPITIEYSIVAAKLIVDNLEELSNDLQNINLRDIVMRACMLAGLSFSNTQTAAAHAMSYYITMHKDIDHGIACSFTLPMLIDNIVGKYEFVDQALIKIFGDLSSLKIRELLSRLSVSTDFIDYGISNEELNKMKLLMDDKRARNSLAFF